MSTDCVPAPVLGAGAQRGTGVPAVWRGGQGWGQFGARGQGQGTAEPAVSQGAKSQLLIQLVPRNVHSCFLSCPLKNQ